VDFVKSIGTGDRRNPQKAQLRALSSALALDMDEAPALQAAERMRDGIPMVILVLGGLAPSIGAIRNDWDWITRAAMPASGHLGPATFPTG
jgi:hypothetical protein